MNAYTERLIRELAIFECYGQHIFSRCCRARRKELARYGYTSPEQEYIYVKTQNNHTYRR